MLKNNKNAFIFHGAMGSPKENWFPWLGEKLKEEHFDVYIPQFPIAQKQSLRSWFDVIDSYDKVLGSNTRLIGHSLGATFALRLLEKINFKINSAFLVAGFSEPLGIRQYDPWNATFFEKPFDWRKIKQNCGKFYVYGSENDPIVKYPLVKSLAVNLGTRLITISDAGHFNSDAGFTKFDKLFIDVKNS